MCDEKLLFSFFFWDTKYTSGISSLMRTAAAQRGRCFAPCAVGKECRGGLDPSIIRCWEASFSIPYWKEFFNLCRKIFILHRAFPHDFNHEKRAQSEISAVRSPTILKQYIWKQFALFVASPSQKSPKDARDIPQCKSTEKNRNPENCIINEEQRKQEKARTKSFRDVQWGKSSLLICIHFKVISSDKSLKLPTCIYSLSRFSSWF